MRGLKESLRNDHENFTYHDHIFNNDITNLVKASEEAYDHLMFREAVKTGFYDLQAARDRYRDITATSDGMNWALVERFIQVCNTEAVKRTHSNTLGGFIACLHALLCASCVLNRLPGC